jgi:uncharacterized protein (DUF2062 family)
MTHEPRICVLIPVYNHALTVVQVTREARAQFPVIVVNDGSTDPTPTLLAAESGLTVIHLAENRGKGAALRAGFAKARELGFTHCLTMDADGQHSASALPEFAAASRRHPHALIVGVRDLKQEGAPLARRLTNELSTFWFKRETGVPLADTQCGYRCYPLHEIAALPVKAERYAYELEIMVKAAWAGIQLIAQPVRADYRAPTSRLSHFKPSLDFWMISCVHSRLSAQTFCVPEPLRRLAANGQLCRLPWGQRLRTIFGLLFTENTETPGRLSLAVGLGLFCGIAPIWGFQMVAAALLAHRLRLNKAIAVTASNVSFPLAAPFILAAGLILGHFLHTGQWLGFSPETVAAQIPIFLGEWIVGSIMLACLVGMSGTTIAFVLAQRWNRKTVESKERP